MESKIVVDDLYTIEVVEDDEKTTIKTEPLWDTEDEFQDVNEIDTKLEEQFIIEEKYMDQVKFEEETTKSQLEMKIDSKHDNGLDEAPQSPRIEEIEEFCGKKLVHRPIQTVKSENANASQVPDTKRRSHERKLTRAQRTWKFNKNYRNRRRNNFRFKQYPKIWDVNPWNTSQVNSFYWQNNNTILNILCQFLQNQNKHFWDQNAVACMSRPTVWDLAGNIISGTCNCCTQLQMLLYIISILSNNSVFSPNYDFYNNKLRLN